MWQWISNKNDNNILKYIDSSCYLYDLFDYFIDHKNRVYHIHNFKDLLKFMENN